LRETSPLALDAAPFVLLYSEKVPQAYLKAGKYLTRVKVLTDF